MDAPSIPTLTMRKASGSSLDEVERLTRKMELTLVGVLEKPLAMTFIATARTKERMNWLVISSESATDTQDHSFESPLQRSFTPHSFRETWAEVEYELSVRSLSCLDYLHRRPLFHTFGKGEQISQIGNMK